MISPKNRFDLFGNIVNEYPENVYKNKTSVIDKIKHKHKAQAECLKIMGGINNNYPVNVYRAPDKITH